MCDNYDFDTSQGATEEMEYTMTFDGVAINLNQFSDIQIQVRKTFESPTASLTLKKSTGEITIDPINTNVFTAVFIFPEILEPGYYVMDCDFIYSNGRKHTDLKAKILVDRQVTKQS
jgi:hypothetical protein